MASACVPVNITFIQGNLLLIRHLSGAAEGEDKWHIKSNAVESLDQVMLEMSMGDLAVDNATSLGGGNIVVPHIEGGGRKR